MSRQTSGGEPTNAADAERVPFLNHEPDLLQDDDSIEGPKQYLEKYITYLCYAYIFIVNAGSYLQIAPQADLFESIICKDYYSNIRVADTTVDCKVPPVQSELALIIGLQDLISGLVSE